MKTNVGQCAVINMHQLAIFELMLNLYIDAKSSSILISKKKKTIKLYGQ